jgi:phosphoribosylglycinamide formyltransferase 1
LERAKQAGVPHLYLAHQSYPQRADYDHAVVEILQQAGVTTLVLAGFMRLVTPTLLDAFPDRVINIHPAILPAFPGIDGQAQALNYGVQIAGCTIHLVDTGTDTGPILAQAAVPVLEDDDREQLTQRILRWEHLLLVEVLRWFSEDAVVIERVPGVERVRIRVPGKQRAFGVVSDP